MVMSNQDSISYEWYKDGEKLESKGNVNIATSKMYSMLIIMPVEENSFGNYTCLAKSLHGSDRHSAYLLVRGNSNNSIFF